MTNAEKEKIKEMIEEGSIYTDPRYKKWRNAIFKRDGHECQYPGCKWPKGKLNAHHIHMKWYNPEWIFKLTNGITLCEYHHTYIHKQGSQKFVEPFTMLAEHNTEHPKVRTRARKLSKKSGKYLLKQNRKKRKKRVVRLVKPSATRVRTVK